MGSVEAPGVTPGEEGNRKDVRKWMVAITALWILFMVSGNLLRVGAFNESGGFPIVEVLLFGAGSVAAVGSKAVERPLYLAGVLIGASWLVGTLRWAEVEGLKPVVGALAYALRLVAMLWAGSFLGKVWVEYRVDVRRLYVSVWWASLLVGALLFALYPRASELWVAMRAVGLSFNGDPHVNRLLGPALDPNFFGALLVLPAALLAVDWVLSGRVKCLAQMSVFGIAILATASRSAMGGLLVAAACTAGAAWLRQRARGRLDVKVFGMRTAVLGLVIAALVLAFGQRTVGRIEGISSDPSAGHRLVSFAKAVDVLRRPVTLLLGAGYDYIPWTGPRGAIVTNFDNSLLNAMVAFGVPGALAVGAAVGLWAAGGLRGLARADTTLGLAMPAYLVAAVAMSMFNDLLFYPLFLGTVVPLLAVGRAHLSALPVAARMSGATTAMDG